MEATAISMGKAVLGGALSYAKSKAAEEVALQLGVEDDVTFITDELQMMQSFLMTADEERSQSKVLTTWVMQVRDLAYNVEDSLMDFGIHAGKKPIWWCNPRNLSDRRRIAKEVKKLRAKVEDVSNRNLRYRLIKDGSSSKLAGAAEQAASDGVAMFGINEKPKADLLQLVTSKEVDLRVMAVWGTTGDHGKTAAIHEVYDHPSVTSRYGLRAWVRLIQPFNPDVFICSMVRQFFENFHELQGGEEATNVGATVLLKMKKMNQSDLVRTFTTKLSSNSYLIVINDLRTVEEWQCIRRFFPDNKKQSRIIVSTQLVDVASLCTEQPYQMSEFKQQLFLFHRKDSEERTSAPEAKPVDLEQGKSNVNNHNLTNNENLKKDIIILEPICDPATPSEIQEECQPRKSTCGNSFSTSTTREKFDRTSTMALDDHALVGRNTEKSEVIKLIGQHSEDMQDCKVISVWGMGGLGKTTLVRSIYRSQQFGAWKRAWVTVPRPFNNEVLIRTLALQLLQDNSTAASDLKEFLEKHECLIVLDDLSSIEEWNMVRDQLAKAKRIIVTTRENSVAKYCSGGDVNTHKLRVLQQEEALALFGKKVFNDNRNLETDMLDQAKVIIKKCDGLPLAISAIGGYLANKPKTATEWRKVNDHLRVELDINPELRRINTVLMRSYDGLPYHLKSAFLYMSIFPEDYKIKRKRLIRRWIAEGYCREMHGMSAAEVGNENFDKLLDRSMILPWEGEIQYGGAINSCQLHDIIREICILKAREENLAFTLEEGCCLSDAQGTIRHLSIASNWKRDKDVLESMVDLSHVRSLTVFGLIWIPFFISDKMRFLRVLDLGDTIGLRDHHLDQIGQLLHLRYLSIRGCSNIYCLPSCLGNLRHLQTVDGRGTSIASLPSAITKLQKLEQLLASNDDSEAIREREDLIVHHLGHKGSCSDFLLKSAVSVRPDNDNQLIDDPASLLYHIRMSLARILFWLSVCSFCWRPQAIDEGLNSRDLFNMESTFFRFPFGGVEAPRGIRKLKALHTLGVVDVARSKTALKELEELTQLRKLGVAGVHSKNSEKFWSVISDNEELRYLSVKGHELDSCLGGDLLPPIHLESLKLEGKLVRVNDWIHELQNLSKLQLVDTQIDSDVDMQAIGQLPNLTVLNLRFGSFMVRELLIHATSFPKLMVLELKGVLCELVSFKEDAMPKLELIHVDYLEVQMHGLAFLESLKEIRLGSRTSDTLKIDVQRQLTGDLKRVSLKLL